MLFLHTLSLFKETSRNENSKRKATQSTKLRCGSIRPRCSKILSAEHERPFTVIADIRKRSVYFSRMKTAYGKHKNATAKIYKFNDDNLKKKDFFFLVKQQEEQVSIV